jgi:membrane protein implicated in regulation of membrane protease activity
MTWESFYLVCFLVGFLLSLLSFLAQMGHFSGSHFHLNGHGHLGHAHTGSCGHGSAGIELSKFNFGTLTAFLTWFGGSGYLFRRYTSWWTLVGLAAAALIGLVGATIVFYVLAKLVSRDRTLDPADFDMIGVLGRVSSTVREGGVGEIVFSQDGARKAAPVRSEDGSPIQRGAEVVVTRYENGIAYVRRWEELAG